MIKLGVRSQSTCTQKGIWLTNNGTLIFKGATVLGNGCKIEIKAGATLVIGSNTGITGDTIINCHKHITLGDFFSCGWNVSICDTDFHECFRIIEGKKQLMKVCKTITIGNFVWVCQNVTILKGTIIPDWCTLKKMENDISMLDFDIAIIGCGAYGMPLAAFVKSMGKQAIHLAGWTQVLFGIIGTRWLNNPRVSSMMNPYWIHPSNKNIPSEAKRIENGAYW
jgi:hypothetical protein